MCTSYVMDLLLAVNLQEMSWMFSLIKVLDDFESVG
jgi:hypothetical protein